uniref:SH3 and cysteine rich domain n=1 Tax=Hippocampus comes TaxID=109280 RepID=A0A3Q2YJQ1_HIPCM
MIPPANSTQEESSGGKEDEQNETPKSPSNTSNQETRVRTLSLPSFTSKSWKDQSDKFASAPRYTIGMAPPHITTGPSIPPVPPAIPCAPPPTSRSQTRNPLQVDSAGHCFMEHIFKKPTFCDVCNHMIVGMGFTRHGLRCKACKMSLHHKCENGVGQQRCMGKLPKGFRRYYSSPLLIQEQYGCIKEVMPIACGNKVDPVYEALRFGTSLAQKAKRASGSESPQRNSVRPFGVDFFTVLENGAEHYYHHQLHQDALQLNTYVALYSFTAQESHDLEMRTAHVSTIICLIFSKGVIEDRIGFFPASFAHQLRTGDQVFRCNRTFIGCREQGQITLKEGQICVSSEDEGNGFIRVASGKKRGFVPCDVLDII